MVRMTDASTGQRVNPRTGLPTGRHDSGNVKHSSFVGSRESGIVKLMFGGYKVVDRDKAEKAAKKDKQAKAILAKADRQAAAAAKAKGGRK